MQVRVGNSVEMADGSWKKQDITLDEIDLQRLLVETGLSPETYVSSQRVFQILEAEAQRLLMALMIARYTTFMGSPENLAQMHAYRDQRNSLLALLKDEHDARAH